MSDLQAIADRVEIEALRGEFTDAAMMRDYDRLASLFTPNSVLRSSALPICGATPLTITAQGDESRTGGSQVM